MNYNKKRKTVLEIAEAIDYDIYKDMFLEETAEEPDSVEGNIDELIDIANKYLK